MNYEDQELVIDLKSLCFYILHQWKAIIITALVCCILSLGIQVVLGNTDAKEEGKDNTLSAAEKYEADKLLLEQQIERCETLSASQYEYMQESVLMQIDCHDAVESYTRLYISTDYQIMPGMTYQNKDYTSAVLSYYHALLADNSILETVGGEVGIDTKYLRELIEVISDSGCYLDIRVWHGEEEKAQEIMGLLIDSIRSHSKTVTNIIGTHSVDILLQSTQEYSGSHIEQKQKDEAAKLNALDTELKATTEKLSALENPDDISLKKIVLVGIIGTVMYVVWLVVSYLFANALRSSDEMEQRYGVRVLGTVAIPQKKTGTIDRWLRNLEGKVSANTEDNYALIAQMLEMHCDAEKTLVVSYRIQPQLAQEIMEELRKHTAQPMLAVSDILKDAAALQELRKHSDIVLVECCDYSRHKDIAKEIQLLRDIGCNVRGCIIGE